MQTERINLLLEQRKAIDEELRQYGITIENGKPVSQLAHMDAGERTFSSSGFSEEGYALTQKETALMMDLGKRPFPVWMGRLTQE
jgi:hypothetical protein